MKVIIELSAKEAAEAVESGVLPLLLSEEAHKEKIIDEAKQEVEKEKATATAEPVPVETATAEPKPVQQVPTTAPAYTLDDLAKASTSIMDAGRMAELQSLVQSFGIASLVELPKDKYGAFALKLRELGAAI